MFFVLATPKSAHAFISFGDMFDGGGAGGAGDTHCACTNNEYKENGGTNNGNGNGSGGGINSNNIVLTGLERNAVNNLMSYRPLGSTLIDVITYQGKTYELFTTVGGPKGQQGPFLGSVEIKAEGGDSNNNNSVPVPTPSQCNAVPNPNLVIRDIVFMAVVNGVATTPVNQNSLKVNTQYQPVVQIRNQGCASTADTRFHKDQAPFGVDGTFPLRLRVDYGNNDSYETTEYTNNITALAAGADTTVRFPFITIPASGNHGIEGTVDVKDSEAVGRGCTASPGGNWGCITERGNPTNNTYEETFTAVAPSVNLQSYMVRPHNFFSGEVPTDFMSGNRNYAGQTRKLGLFWTGALANLTTCTGTAVTSLGVPIGDFNGRPDPTTVSSRNNRYVSRLGTANYDYNIIEPPVNTNHIYTINCAADDGTIVSDTITISNNGPAIPASAILNGDNCEIQSGRSSCPALFTWDIEGASLPRVFNDSTNEEYSNNVPSQTNILQSIARGDNTVQALDGTRVLREITVTGTCAVSAPWNSARGICYDPNSATPGTISVTAQSAVVRKLDTTNIRWQISSPIPSAYTCTLNGPGLVNIPITTQTGTQITQPIESTSIFSVRCDNGFTPISSEAIVEIIPEVQEV